ncbi:hypothetical protein K1T71_001016 [Dendrolimus kikuchii]|uniref:Uncharacterized protein n=1 Tax=Dendrolimus kikuchii TaxID=765133 RepID=A0ACC1DGU8_9NEOP|nr:hypothetical protein K1T71_001016 [Dendrolimus kikuchii]
MDQTPIINFCKDLGCCYACCLRYLGLKNPKVFENCRKYVLEILENGQPKKNDRDSAEKSEIMKKDENAEEPVNKKMKMNDTCVSCMGLLQEESWPNYFQALDVTRKGYETDTFACGLSAPMTTLLREKAVILRLCNQFTEYDATILTPLKEAWKWTFGVQMAKVIGKSLDSGAVSPLLITLNMEYPDDLQELEILKTLSPSLFELRSKQKKRFTVEFTRRSVEEALTDLSLEALQGVDGWKDGLPAVEKHVKCVSVVSVHTPMYLGGRYIKLSRELPQTPWMVNGVRMMDSSVQEIIFDPIARMNLIEPADVEHRLKFMSAGREDVDVRCLGQGRPFAVEITDPRKQLSPEELKTICKEISKTGKVIVKDLIYVTKVDLTELKKGEETKCKTYEALCIKLSHSEYDHIVNPDSKPKVTENDIERINSYSNTSPSDEARIVLKQKTPVRVLHRRPLLTRQRRIYELIAKELPDHPQLFTLVIKTEAGTYIKEWVHGDLGRTRPHLGEAIKAKVDILALDVASVHLQWPLVNNKN